MTAATPYIYKEKLVFGLDIGTRSIVGTVGYKDGGRFIVVAQRTKEHETRAMLDGQIHDIHRVGQTILEVRKELEEAIGQELHEVCIAAAGRVLRTINAHAEQEFENERNIGEEDVLSLISQGIEQAYEEFHSTGEMEIKFYCVGYSVVRYFMNGYPMGNLEDHKAKNIGVDLIATFLPDDVVDGLYKAVEYAGLTVANLTLEPIAAIQVAIPEKFRMLNMALVDVGAGTSDISITQGGSITAYGMIPMAGDSLTDILVQHCLTEFAEAEKIKRAALTQDTIEYVDIMGLPQTISREEVLQVIQPAVAEMTKKVSECIKELNGEKAVSAVFVVGGGGKIPGYCELLAEELGIQKERVALRGEEVMHTIDFLESDVKKDSLLVTPVGICLCYYEQSNNFIFVTFNEQRVKLYDNTRLTVVDAAIQSNFPNDGLFPKRGKELQFTVNGKQRIVRGLPGEAAVITVNGQEADIHTPIHSNDVIVVKESTAGETASMELGQLSEFKESLHVTVNEKKISLPRYAQVNGELQSGYYTIKQQDDIEFRDWCSVEQIAEFMDVSLAEDMPIYVNNTRATRETKVYEDFSVVWSQTVTTFEETEEVEADENVKSESESASEPEVRETAKDVSKAPSTASATGNGQVPTMITVVVNGRPIVMKGKSRYIYVDVFDYINFDLSKPQGSGIVTKLNERPAQYMEQIVDGDRIEIRWEK